MAVTSNADLEHKWLAALYLALTSQNGDNLSVNDLWLRCYASYAPTTGSIADKLDSKLNGNYPGDPGTLSDLWLKFMRTTTALTVGSITDNENVYFAS